MSLTEAQIAIVKSTAPVLKEHGNTITTIFYKSLLEAHPELRNLFSLRNQQTGAQQKALANAVIGYASFIDDLPKLKGVVERIAQKHASLYVQPEQYAIVGEHLMKAIGEVLGDALTPEIAEAWTLAYGQLAGVFIKREGQLYAEAGPWTGWRKFKILRRIAESDSVTSFYLAPSDGVTPLPKFLPGQYISVQVPIPQLDGLYQSRQYSLSEAPQADYYRISIKREATIASASSSDIGAGLVPGLVSNLLHDAYQTGDEVELSFPRGDFHLDAADITKADTPLILLSAGVGATPLISVLNTVLAPESKTSTRPIRWIHAARNSNSLVFGKHVRALCRERENVTAHVFLDEVKDGDEVGREYDFDRRLDLGKLEGKELGIGADADYFVCGPRGWMLGARDTLVAMGVERERIRLELFATGDVEDE